MTDGQTNESAVQNPHQHSGQSAIDRSHKIFVLRTNDGSDKPATTALPQTKQTTIMKRTIAITCLVATAGFANAAATYIDFATVAGSTGTVGGNTWNTISTTGPNAIVDTGNTASGSLTLTFNNVNADGTTPGFGGGAFNNGDTVGATAPAFLMNGGTPIASAIGDGLFVNDGAGGDYIVFSLTGLAVSTEYTFTVYGGRNDANFVNNALIRDASDTTTLASYGDRASDTFNLTTDVSGALSFRFTEDETVTNTATNSTLVGMSFESIPEPSSAVLLGFGGLALVLRRRK